MLNNITNNSILLLLACAISHSANAAQTNVPAKTETDQHTHAVDLARSGKIEQGMAILKQLLAAQPTNYPIRRDYIIIATWKGDCDDALDNYKLIEKHPRQEAYLIVPVSECLQQQGEDEKALALLEKHSKSNPQDQDLKQAYLQLRKAIKLERLPVVSLSIGTNNTDAGNREWFWDLRYSRQIKPDLPQLRGYVHFYSSHALDTQFDTGDLNRLGIGVLYWFNPQWLLDQELFTDLQTDETGSRTQLRYLVNSQLQLSGEYSSNTDDIPLRAKAQLINAHRTRFDADYHSQDYRWELYGAVSKYKLSDTNKRDTLYGSVGYGYLMKQQLEQRVILELSQSKNTLGNAIYFNPTKDRGVNLVHRTSYVYDSQYDRHVDHLSIFVGRYNQENYDSASTYGARYEQEYNFDEYDSLSWGVGYASRVYDGQREGEWSFLITMSRKLD